MTNYALIGNPNVGKTSLYNRLTHSFEHVGNWHGVTVDKVSRSVGKGKGGGEEVNITDLPGLYSLTVYSKEEEISRDEAIGGHSDLYIDVCDANNLHRNLYLYLQLVELDVPVMIAVNMIDELRRNGSTLDTELLSKRLGVPVLAVSAKKGFDTKEFLRVAQMAVSSKKAPLPYLKKLPLSQVEAIIGDKIEGSGLKHNYALIKALECDEFVMKKLGLSAEQRARLKKFDGQSLVAKLRYEYIDELLTGAMTTKEKGRSPFDKLVLNKYLALPMFLLIMSGIFWVTFGPIGSFFTDLLDNGKVKLMEVAGEAMTNSNFPKWLNGLICEGVINGVGGVLVFLPQIVILFFFLALMEDSGYISRVAFMTDGFFGKIGLNGRAVFTMIMGFGCSATAVLTSRGLEDDNMRKKTAMLTPFISCSARLPVYTAVLGAFFTHGSVPMIFGLYVLGCVIVIALAAIFNGTKKLKSGAAPFMMEMPPYRMPTAQRVLQILLSNAKTFLIKVGTLVFTMSVIVWILGNFSFRYGYIGMGSGESIMEQLGALIAPLFAPLGFGNWKAVTSLMSGLVAKEVVISTMTSLGGVEEVLVDPLAAVCFLVYTLLYVPCFATLGAIKKEVGTKWMLFALTVQLSVAYLTTFLLRMTILAFMHGILNGIVMIALIMSVIGSVIAIKSIFFERRRQRCNGCGGCL